MNKKTKETIAREFLFLLGITTLFFVVVFSWLILSNLNRDKEDELQQEIQTLTKPEKLPYRLKIFYYINNEIIESPEKQMTNSEKFISTLKNEEEASIIYDGIKEEGNIRSTKDEFFEKITKDSESEAYLAKLRILEHELEETKKSFFNKYAGDDEIFGFGILLVSIFFVLRYLIYGTVWSIKQLKE